MGDTVRIQRMHFNPRNTTELTMDFMDSGLLS